jgi:hypothetical protein
MKSQHKKMTTAQPNKIRLMRWVLLIGSSTIHEE